MKEKLFNGLHVASNELALVLSIIAICRSYERCIHFDYMGIIVGALAILVTVLIGYNIYNLIDINSRFHSMESEFKSSYNEVLKSAVHYSSCYGLLANATTMLRNGETDRAIESLFHLLEEVLKLKWPEGTSIIPVIISMLTKHLGENPERMSHIKTSNLKHFEVLLLNTGNAEAIKLAKRIATIE